MSSALLALRNLFRHRRRTLLTGLTVFWGCLILAVTIGLTDGTYGRVIDGFARGWTGHLQIHREGFNGVCYADTAIPDFNDVIREVATDPRVAGVVSRIKLPMFLSASGKSANVYALGIDAAAEARVIGLKDRLKSGHYLESGASPAAMLGHALFEQLGIKLGDSVVLLGYAADGSLANGKYQVVGTLETGDPGRDAGFVYLPIEEAMVIAALEGQVQEIAIVAQPGVELDELANTWRAAFAGKKLEVQTWHEFARGFYRAVKADAATKSLAVAIVSCVVGLGVWNTMLMNILERKREFSLMRALGTSRGFVARMIIGESLFLTFPAALLGSIGGMGLNHLLSHRGIPLGQNLTYGGMQFESLHTMISARSLYLPASCVLAAALLVALVSAAQAVRISLAIGLRNQ